MQHQQIRLTGPRAVNRRVSATLLTELLNVFIAGTRAALRYRVQGRSTSPGTQPAWLVNAADFEVVGLETGSTVIEIEAKTLIEAAPDKFQQQQLFWNFDPNESAFGLFEEALSDALEGKADSELFDSTILAICTRFTNVFSEGIDAIQIANGKPGKLEIKAEGVDRIKKLRTETPLPRRVRIAGKLEMIRASGSIFEVVLESGDRIKGIMANAQPEEMKRLFDQDVVISGLIEFRPSGRPLRIDADAIEKANGDVSFWSKLPKPVAGVTMSTIRQPQTPSSGLSKIIGQWPGDESDEQIEELLEQIS